MNAEFLIAIALFCNNYTGFGPANCQNDIIQCYNNKDGFSTFSTVVVNNCINEWLKKNE